MTPSLGHLGATDAEGWQRHSMRAVETTLDQRHVLAWGMPSERHAAHPTSSVEPSNRGTDLRVRLAASRLYLCTDARRESGDLLEFVDAALTGGVDIVQLRDKGAGDVSTLSAREELAVLAALREVVDAHGALLAVNDRADLAAIAGADVLHVGQGDVSPAQARTIVGDDVLIGVSTHDPAQARAAAMDATIDYFCTGPCWPTPTKPGRAAPGLDLVREVSSAGTDVPWFAIGGIDERRLPAVIDAGATRAVVVRAITTAADPADAAAALRRILTAA